MKRAAVIVASLVAGYLAGAFGGGWLVGALSPNTHDRSVEAAMTGAFATGPLVAAIAVIVAIWLTRPR
jgi:hypothetical protein